VPPPVPAAALVVADPAACTGSPSPAAAPPVLAAALASGGPLPPASGLPAAVVIQTLPVALPATVVPPMAPPVPVRVGPTVEYLPAALTGLAPESDGALAAAAHPPPRAPDRRSTTAPVREPEPSAPPAPIQTPSSSCSSGDSGSSASGGQSRRNVRTGLPYCVLPPDTDAALASVATAVSTGIADGVRTIADDPGVAPD
jgi:hypothetical protein